MIYGRSLVALLTACGLFGGPAAGDPERGRALYHEGRLASGETVEATVLGDVPISQVTCSSCHGRSGMGTEEQGDRTPPIAAPLLFTADAQTGRPPYNEASIARALREGIDSEGEPLEALMPRYTLTDGDVASLTAYLRTLGAEPSPGIDNDNLWLATVVAGDVDPAERTQMLDVLESWVEIKNAQWRNEGGRSHQRREPDRAYRPWRLWHLDVWTLTGPPDTWRAQLAERYAEQPPFAMVSGLAAGPWSPMHEFCEEQGMPCVLPNTDRPGERGDWYTMYFSGGMGLEARVVAADLAARRKAGERPDGPVVQLVGTDPRAAAAATEMAGVPGLRTVAAADGDDALKAALADASASAVVGWLTPAEWARIGPIPDGSGDVIASGTLLREAGEAGAPDSPRLRVVQPFRGEGDSDPGMQRFRAWAQPRGFPIADDARLQAQTWFACMTLMRGAKHLERYPFRDFLLDSLDHAAGLSSFLPIYPRAVLGPGQRVLAKGAYIEDPSGTEAPRWVVP